MNEYRIKRYCKAGKLNANGYIFDLETTNRALDKYIGKKIILVENKYDQNDYAIIKPIESIGTMTKYDNEYIYCKDLNPTFINKTNDMTCGLVVRCIEEENTIIENQNRIVYPEEIIEIRVWEK